MAEPAVRAFIVTLNFGNGGPLWTGIVGAPDQATAVAGAAVDIVRHSKTENRLVSVISDELTAEELRNILRLIEGDRAPAEVLSIVRQAQEAAGIHTPGARFSGFGGHDPDSPDLPPGAA